MKFDRRNIFLWIWYLFLFIVFVFFAWISVLVNYSWYKVLDNVFNKKESITLDIFKVRKYIIVTLYIFKNKKIY